MTKPAPEPEADDPLWTLWRALVREFRFSRLLGLVAFSRSGWGLYGVDVVSTLSGSAMARGARAVLAEAPDGLLERLIALAAVNARRNEAMWRMAALFYVTAPVTLFLAGLEGAPDFVRGFFAERGPFLAVLVGLMTVWLLYYFANQWRARQMEAVLELVRIERRAGA